jgi:hypothetical protein
MDKGTSVMFVYSKDSFESSSLSETMICWLDSGDSAVEVAGIKC